MFAKSIVTKGGDVFRDEYSLAFDGTNDYVEIADAPSFSYNVHSISMWVKPAGESGSMSLFDYRDANNDGIHIYLGDGDVVYQIDNTDGHYDTKLDLNQWSHVVCTNDGSTSTIYLNGVSVETADTSGETINVSGSAVPRIAARSHTSPSNYFNGNISEVALYSSALTANQVKTIYNGREPYNHKEGVASGNLQAWWRMGDGTLDTYAVICNEKNNTLGTNIVVNGTFASDSSWTKGTGWTIGSGTADCDGSQSGNTALSQTYSSGFTSGKEYQVQFTISDYTAGNINPHITGASSGNVTGNGTKTSLITATSSNNDIVMYADSAFDAKIDNITVREIGDGAGKMVNMDSIDIEGDTP